MQKISSDKEELLTLRVTKTVVYLHNKSCSMNLFRDRVTNLEEIILVGDASCRSDGLGISVSQRTSYARRMHSSLLLSCFIFIAAFISVNELFRF